MVKNTDNNNNNNVIFIELMEELINTDYEYVHYNKPIGELLYAL